MDITSYVGSVRQQLAAAAEAGGDDVRALAERLIAPLESAIRLALLEALAAAADEITTDLAPGSVDLRLRGGSLSFVVTAAPDRSPSDVRGEDSPSNERAPLVVPALSPGPSGPDDGATSRINFRPPEHLKARIEQAARGEQLSVNAWLVRAVAAVLESGQGHSTERRAPRGGQRYTGWVR